MYWSIILDLMAGRGVLGSDWTRHVVAAQTHSKNWCGGHARQHWLRDLPVPQRDGLLRHNQAVDRTVGE